MNEQFGQNYRIIRMSQNLTLREVSEGIVSLSYLAKFETGKTNITLPIFIQLLDRINISIDDFIFFCEGSISNFDYLVSKITEAYRNDNLSALIELKNIEDALFNGTERSFHKINSIMLSAVIVDLSPSYSIPKEDLKIMSDYLLQIPFWSSYNLFVLSNSLAIISPFLLITLIDEITRLDKKKLIRYSSPRELIFLCHHASITFLRNGNLQQAISAHNYAKNFLKAGFFFEKSRSLFISGLIEIYKKNTYEGLKMAEDAITVITILEPPLVKRYIIELTNTLQKVLSI